jgi:CO/xanthine dehydrogenase FAD-binding subunit
MPEFVKYERPSGIAEAVLLLSAPEAVPLAGGTHLNATPDRTTATAVDLQALGLDGVASSADAVRIGATTTLQHLADHPEVPALVRELAVAESPRTFRNIATIGGTAADASPTSRLAAALLVHQTEVEIETTDGAARLGLADFWRERPQGALITSLHLATGGTGAHCSTARTPADEPIVAAVGLSHDGAVTLALTGVAQAPVLVDPAGATAGLSPPGDFRGSPAYRLELAAVLSARVLEELA